MDRIFEIGTRLGLEGEDLRTFIHDQQNIERENRAKEREEREKERNHEIEMKKLELLANESNTNNDSSDVRAKANCPKLPSFIDYKDDLDSYLNRFERFAKCNNWDKSTWSTSLSALLSGRALDVYSRLSDSVASDYDGLKRALLKRYELTEAGFRNRFRNAKPEQGESPEQFITRLQNYLSRWIELSNTNKDFSSVCDLFTQEQFISACSPDLAVFLKERSPSNLEEVANLADQYLLAHNRSLASNNDVRTKVNHFNIDNNVISTSKQQSPKNFHRSSTVNYHSGNSNTLKCIFCSFWHKSENCHKVSLMDIKQRRDLVKASNACFLCLKQGHISKHCFSGNSCTKCHTRHHTLLCDSSKNAPPDAVATTSTSLSSTHSPKVLLMTATVFAKGVSPLNVQTRVLIDGGSQRSYIRTTLVDKIKANKVGSELLQIQSFGENFKKCNLDLVSVTLSSKVDDNKTSFKLLSTSQLCSPLEMIPNGPWLTELEERGFILADDIQNSSNVDRESIDIILGADQMWKIFTSNVFSTSYGIVASETKFGWVLQGPISNSQSSSTCVATTNALFTVDVSKFWELETMNMTDDSTDELSSLNKFYENIERENDGRYKVPLLWKNTETNLDSNFEIAKNRLKYLNKRLENNPNLKKEYSKVFEEYEELDIIEKVPETEIRKNESVFYLPHHAVVKENNESTKVRPVFDGSVKNKGSVSLNEVLDCGPSLLPQLIDLLLRFRYHTIPFTGDITKAFLQLSVKEIERDYLRFLWNDSTYRFKRVCFGITCAPFLLNATIRYHLMNCSGDIAEKMSKSFYVDDLISGSSSIDECIAEIKTSSTIMKAACMNLTKWTTSSQQLAQNLHENHDIEMKCTGITKVLGIPWNLDTDELEIFIPDFNLKGTKLTKRIILSYTAKIFDPFGFACPIVVSLKLFIKSLWLKGYDWDVSISNEETEEFFKMVSSFSDCQKISIPRCYCEKMDDISKPALHVFCDASEQAYSACVYLQTTSSNGSMFSAFVISKSRLAPVKRVTLPRLELLSCHLGSKLLKIVLNALGLKNADVYCWTDSSIALSWIRSSSSRYKQFVSNRVQAIQEVIPPSCWNHCPGVHNPADQATRLTSFRKWNKSTWFYGPIWLNNVSEWPSQQNEVNTNRIDEDILEMKKEDVNLSCACTTEEIFFDISRYSSLKKAVNVLVCVQRAINKFKELIYGNQENSEDEPYQEFQKAKNKLIELEQTRYFSSEISCLVNKKSVAKDSSLKNLTLTFRDGLLYSIGRLDFDELIVLPNDSHLTKLVILDIHIRMCHSGVAATLTELRMNYWITKGRRVVRSAIRLCLICRRHDCKSYLQQEAPLSDYRLNQTRPFEITGCDFTGPFFLKNGKKVYILVFTCTVIRAVHLELCSSQKLDDFLLAFRRFQARFDTPKLMLSDNFSTFKSAKGILKENIEWKHLPEYSPHWGGMWERIIKSVKRSLKRVLGNQKVKFEVLHTVLHEIEASINKRPLTYVSDEQEDMKPLRPIDFFTGSCVESTTETADQLIKGFRQRTHFLSQLWSRWKNEYLIELRSWYKRRTIGKGIPKVGDIVLVDPKSVGVKNRSLWPLGRILEVHVGKGNFPRFVKVLSQGKICRRNTSQIYPLEFD